MAEHKSQWGSIELGEIQRVLSERWADIEDKEKAKYERMAAKRKEKTQGLMDVYQAAVDPVGYLKKKYEHLIPKRPRNPYWIFQMDDKQRQAATAALKQPKRQKVEGEEQETRVAAKLHEMWTEMSDEDKAPYTEKSKEEKVEFEQKWKVWQKTKQFAEIDALEKKQKEAERAKKQKEKEAEEAEMQELLEGGVQPGKGLKVGRERSSLASKAWRS
jgi:hypothetical protein